MSYFKITLTTLLVVALMPTQALAIHLEDQQHIAGAHAQTLDERADAKRNALEYRNDQVIIKVKGEDRFRTLPIAAGRSVDNVISELTQNPQIEYAEPDYVAHKTATPNDPYYSPYQWHLDNSSGSGINAEEAWDITTGSPDIIVAIVDTGVAYEDNGRYKLAPDLANTCFVDGYDFINNDSHANDDEGHGTHVAGTVAQSTNNGIGVAGVAYDTCVMPVKVLDQNGSGSYSAVANGIYFAVDNGADVINMSLGGTADSSTLENAVAYAYNNDVTVIAAAGNSNTSEPHYPSSYNNYVISVGATDYTKARAPYSNYGPDVDIAAPGGNTSVDANGDGYVDGVLQQTFGDRPGDFGYYFYQGTSMASPHVAGVAALLMANTAAVTPDDIRTALESTAQDIGDSSLGAGLVDAYAALQWTAGPVDNPPVVAVTNPLSDDIVTGSVLVSASSSDDNGVASVEFLINGTSIGTDFEAPYELTWDTTTQSDGTYTVTALSTDTAEQTAQDSVDVVVDNINDAPVADAGVDQLVSDADGTESEVVTLDGSNSYDPDGTIESHVWSVGGSTVATSATFSIDQIIGSTTYTLTVTDNEGDKGSDSVTVTVQENTAPVADAGEDQTAVVDTAVSFDASGSYDPDGSIDSYAWDFGDGSTASDATVSHTYTVVGTYTATLSVTDNGGKTATDTTEITITDAQKITLEAIGYKYRGRQKADLMWEGVTTDSVDIYRDGVLLETTSNNGSYTDHIDNLGGGSYIYQVCEVATSNCSNESTVTF